MVAMASLSLEARAEITVTASIQPAATTIGEPVQLSVTVNGSQRVAEVPVVNVDGAKAQHIGASTQFSVVNGSFSSAITHRFLITPMRGGELIIPAIEVTVEGKKYETAPVKLQVSEPGQPAAGEPAQPVPLAEVQLPRKFVYVGESFAADARLLIPAGHRWQIERMPDFQTDAFTKTPFLQPQQQQFVKDGQEYTLCTFRTLMTAVKSGKVPIGPLTFSIQIAVPKKNNQNAPSPFGGIFNGFPFDNQPTAMQERKVILPEQTFEVLELPAEGRPDSFRGAIGRFNFNASTNQSTVKAGEPLSLTLKVEGEGNFDRIEAPPMVDPDGWRAYPPEASFAKSDETSFRGVKTFQLAVVPEKGHRQIPVFEFAWFDPDKGTYQILKSTASALAVEGLKEPPPSVTQVEATAKPEKKPAPAPDPGSPVQETLTVAPQEAAFWSSRRIFWGLQAFVALVVGSIGTVVFVRRSRSKNGPSREALARAAALESSMAQAKGRSEVLRQAVRVVQLRTSARNGQPDGAVDANAAVQIFGGENALAQELSWLFENDAAQQFAGNPSDAPMGAQERARVVALLDRVR